MPHNNFNNLKKFIEIVEILRSDNGCPWDREQTHKSIKANMLEEAYEAIDAIDSGSSKDLCEELGDVLLQVVLHSQIASEENKFDIEDVAKTISEKIIRRHPHVFGDLKVSGTKEVLANWDLIKQQEKPERKSALSGVAKSQPALLAAAEYSKKAVKVGFEWPNVESLWECLQSEIEEFKHEADVGDKELMEDELGDVLFSIVNVARWHKINPELALLRANKKFKKRFQLMEQIADKDLKEYTQDELEELWIEAKKALSTQQ
ncbi:MAG: nucleoside triphosphate pyrophosphohydrolase [Candidatus Gastranaerophilales bacterium]|nr:nucleoside triphosphate pyrophosphohydrolase [Candidatus Gastranaerophilales bacterium]